MVHATLFICGALKLGQIVLSKGQKIRKKFTLSRNSQSGRRCHRRVPRSDLNSAIRVQNSNF